MWCQGWNLAPAAAFKKMSMDGAMYGAKRILNECFYFCNLAISQDCFKKYSNNIKKKRDKNSHCLDLDLNGKRPGITFDCNFSSYVIGRS